MRKSIGKKVQDEFERHGIHQIRQKSISWCVVDEWVGR